MDFTPIIAQVWGTLGWFIPLMLLIGLLKSPWAKGHIGELLVGCLPIGRCLHNVTVNTPEGTTQIGHVSSPPTASSCWKRRTYQLMAISLPR